MLGIRSHTNNPYFNIASEEHLLRKFTDDVFMLYTNTDSVIVGKHQNTMGEINLHYVKENNLPVIRRLSGGGTVYHDLQNLNFAFIQNGEDGKLIDFNKFISPIIQFLKTKGITATAGKRNDIIVDGKKISGNAEHVFKNRVLHHGTLLFESNLDALNKSIKVNLDQFTDKSVKSNRSVVTNLKPMLPDNYSLELFTKELFEFVLNTYEDSHEYVFSDEDNNAIDNLIETKYATWDWNFAYSPKYEFSKTISINNYDFSFKLNFEKAKLTNLELKTEHPDFIDFNKNAQLFVGHKHEPSDLLKVLASQELTIYWKNCTPEEFLHGFY